MIASMTSTNAPRAFQAPVSLQTSIIESCRYARELEQSLGAYKDLLEQVANSPFVAHMRHLRSSVVG
jgi:hypothetical protein